MSHEAIQWAIHDAPTATTAEFAVVVALGEKAGPDGCGAFPSRGWLAERTKLDPKAVQRNLAELERRGVITSGDQRRAEYIRADRRPHVWDLPIPAAWYEPGRLAKINQDRVVDGFDPLTADSRPLLAPAPAKARRSDLGKPRTRPDGTAESEAERGDSESPRQTSRGVSQSPRDSPRGDCESRTGGLSIPHGGTESPPNLKEEPKTESLSRSDPSERPDGQRPKTREREDLGEPNTPDPAGPIVQAWIDSWARTHGVPHPVKTPEAIRRDARELLTEGIDAELLRLAAADMAKNRGWNSLHKHLEHFVPPASLGQAPNESGSARTAADCRWCDPFGWYETPNGDARCTHPDHPPAGHPAAAQTRSAA